MFDFRVDIIEVSGVKIEISPLSVTPEPGARGIADINISDINPDEPGFVLLHVYITKREKDFDKKIRVYKEDPNNARVGLWQTASNQKGLNISTAYGKWAGHIEVTLTSGDPPIAVG